MTGFLKLFFIALLSIGLFSVANVFAVSDSANVNLQVTGICNFNGDCDSGSGETEAGCSADCGCNNNGVCQTSRGENTSNCPADCVTTPEPVVETPTGGGGPIIFQIKNIVVSNITTSSADISWLTNQFATCQIFWGKTSEYEKETILETNFVTAHLIKLKNLDFSSPYHFKITCADHYNEKAVSSDYEFYTVYTIGNVTNFTAVASDKKIVLQWENPSDKNFDQVRMMRSENFYPLNINDGAIIYEGYDNYFIDTNLKNGRRYYYTIFVKDKDNNYSSGALSSAVPNTSGTVSPAPVIPSAPAEVAKMIKFQDFDFFSQGTKLQVKNNETVEIENKNSLIISIDYEKLPQNAKNILIEIKEDGKTYSYLFKIRNNRTLDILIPALGGLGNYPVKITILNDKNQKIQEVKGDLKVFEKQKAAQQYFLWMLAWGFINLFLWLILILLIVILWLLIKRKNK